MFLRRLDSFDGTFTWLVARMCSSISRMYIEGGYPGGASLMVSSFLRPCQSRWLTLAYIVSSLDIFPSKDRHQRQIWICLWLRCRVWDIMAVSIRYSSGQEEKDVRSVAPIMPVLSNLRAPGFILRLAPLYLIPILIFFPRVICMAGVLAI